MSDRFILSFRLNMKSFDLSRTPTFRTALQSSLHWREEETHLPYSPHNPHSPNTRERGGYMSVIQSSFTWFWMLYSPQWPCLPNTAEDTHLPYSFQGPRLPDTGRKRTLSCHTAFKVLISLTLGEDTHLPYSPQGPRLPDTGEDTHLPYSPQGPRFPDTREEDTHLPYSPQSPHSPLPPGP